MKRDSTRMYVCVIFAWICSAATLEKAGTKYLLHLKKSEEKIYIRKDIAKFYAHARIRSRA